MNPLKSQVLGWWWTSKVILNSSQTAIPSEEARTSKDTVTKVRTDILKLKGSYISEDGLSVDYAAMGASEQLTSYKTVAASLNEVNLLDLSETERRSFFINTYNSLVVHALAEGILAKRDSVSTFSRLKFYASASYIIGGFPFCLNDIEHGVLRGNRPSPVPLTSPIFPAEDPRLQFSVACDPRIHFALNCGAKSCPPIGIYSSESDILDRQLSSATELFLDSTVRIDAAQHAIYLSKIFEWYKQDFGASDAEVVQWIRNHASETLKGKLDEMLTANQKAPKLLYDPYDWSLNS